MMDRVLLLCLTPVTGVFFLTFREEASYKIDGFAGPSKCL